MRCRVETPLKTASKIANNARNSTQVAPISDGEAEQLQELEDEMNLNQIITMVMRTVMRRVVNSGINAGMNAGQSALAKRKKPSQPHPDDIQN